MTNLVQMMKSSSLIQFDSVVYVQTKPSPWFLFFFSTRACLEHRHGGTWLMSVYVCACGQLPMCVGVLSTAVEVLIWSRPLLAVKILLQVFIIASVWNSGSVVCVCCTAAGVWRVCVCEGMVVVMLVVVVLRGGGAGVLCVSHRPAPSLWPSAPWVMGRPIGVD